jgi:tetratricopeptide (TPR) repeat protein
MASSEGNALSLIKAVLELVADRRTGVLDVRSVGSEGVRTQIYFADGKLLFAEDEALGETFGRLLMRQGVISNDQFVRVIDEMTRAATGNNQLRFGEVAVALGFLKREQVERGLAEQVCGIVNRALARGESRWEFDASPTAARAPRSFFLAINPAVLEALRQSNDPSTLARIADVVAAGPEEFVVVAGSQLAPAVDVRDTGSAAGGEAHATRMAAEQAFQRGMALLRDAKTASAAIELRRASELQPESLEYLLYATWARARSYREVPIEADQQALLEIAQRAKRRDPAFAFGSYVIGQVSMWTGDEATAKKFFYEALRLDPTSEAGQQVRILARRGTAGPAQPGAEGPPRPEAPAEPAPVAARVPAVANVPPAQAVPASPPSKAPSSGGSRWLVPGLALLATAAIGIFAVARRSPPAAELAPSVSPQPALSVDASPAVEQERADTPAPPPPPLKETKVMTDKDAEEAGADADMGTVLLPPRAAGHRIFVDGRRGKTDGSEPLRLRCGRHAVQIGSSGTPETIDLPCGGEVQLQ